MRPLTLLLGLLLGAGFPGSAWGHAPAPAAEDGPRFRVGLLSAPDLNAPGLTDALALRLPGLELRTEWTDEAMPGRVFIRVHPTEDGTAVRTEVIADDGRGYARRLDIPPDDVRRIASVLANLLFSIENESVAADVEDVEVPRTSDTREVERAVAKLEDPAPEPEPEPEPKTEPEPEPKTEPEPEPAPKPKPPTEAPEPMWRASVPVAGGLMLGLGPPAHGRLLQGGGLALGADGEHRGGARFGLRLRYLASDESAFRLSRLRIGVGGGYGWRVGRLDLPVRGELSVEPWWVSFEGDRLDAAALDAPRSGLVALGGGLRFEPALEFPVGDGVLSSVRAGVSTGLAGSFVLDQGAVVATVTSGDPDTADQALFRIGGLELWLGLQVTVVLTPRS